MITNVIFFYYKERVYMRTNDNRIEWLTKKGKVITKNEYGSIVRDWDFCDELEREFQKYQQS